MWKNVTVNFLVLSFIVFSGEYLHYRVELQNAPKENNKVRSGISGSMYGSSNYAIISGASYPLNAKFHICGTETTSTRNIISGAPTDKATPNNLMTTSSS